MPTPSERTIENLSNHALLEILNFGRLTPPFAWMYVPSQTDEHLLGYDAALQGYKRLFIQYKSRNNSGSFTFDFRQIWLLCWLHPRHTYPYVFLAGNTRQNYGVIAADHMPPGGTRYAAFGSTFFLDAWLLLDNLIDEISGGACAVPNILPFAPPNPCVGDVTLMPTFAGFTGKIGAGTNLQNSLIDFCIKLGFAGPFAAGNVGPLAIAGWGQFFADAVCACRFGRDLALPLQVDARLREVAARFQPLLRNQSVLTLPMP